MFFTFFIILITFLVLYLLYVLHYSLNNNTFLPIFISKNSDYQGIGQVEITGEDGYFTTFTTIDENKKTYKEFKQNGTSSWAQNSYWGGTMEENGCGITAISIIASEPLIFILGILVSFIIGLLCIKFLLKYLRKHDFKIFMIYRIILAIVVLITVLF